MAAADAAATPLELWGGPECTVNRVHERWNDQIVRTGHHDRIDDLDRFAGLGLTAVRYPALWERVAPASLDTPDWGWLDARLQRLRTLGLKPILGLVHHGSGPAYTSLADPAFPSLLARFARMVAERYPWVEDYTPVNEPLTTARFSALYGFWFPHHRADASFARALLHQCRGTVDAMRAIREVTPAARLIQTEDCGDVSGTDRVAAQVEHERHRRWLTWDLLTGRVQRRHPLYEYLLSSGLTPRELAFFSAVPCPPDVIGLNYYLTSDRHLDHRLDRYPAWSHGSNGRLRYADIEAVRGRPEGIAGHEAHLLAAWQRYGLPLALTEVHLGCTREEQARWLLEAWTGAQWARGRGAEVKAVTAWALLGSFDWNVLLTHDGGHYEPGAFDIRAPEPRATFLVPMLRELAAGRLPSHPLLSSPGWWRRAERLLHATPQPAIGPVRDERTAPPLLIVSGRNGSTSEFERACRARGIPIRLAHAPETNLADAESVERAFDAPRPWAVIRVWDPVSVDDAEADPDRCWQDLVTGTTVLASACARHGARLLTFSSDLVFDGTSLTAYTEVDPVRPLNVYGCAQMEAEARVVDIAPDSLIVRTGPRFSGDDDGNFVAAVRRTLGGGERLLAANDTTMSPTFIPDLVTAALDLLIDGERGIWHLANGGAITWYAFARRIAERYRLPHHLLEAAPASVVWPEVKRPANSALASVRGAVMRTLDGAIDALAEAGSQLEIEGRHSCTAP